MGKLVHTRDNQPIYQRGADLIPPEYLACNQSEPDRVEKVKAAAEARRQQRNARRLAKVRGRIALIK